MPPSTWHSASSPKDNGAAEGRSERSQHGAPQYPHRLRHRWSSAVKADRAPPTASTLLALPPHHIAPLAPCLPQRRISIRGNDNGRAAVMGPACAALRSRIAVPCASRRHQRCALQPPHHLMTVWSASRRRRPPRRTITLFTHFVHALDTSHVHPPHHQFHLALRHAPS